MLDSKAEVKMVKDFDVSIRDVNDNSPYFAPVLDAIQIRESIPVGDEVFVNHFLATDLDCGKCSDGHFIKELFLFFKLNFSKIIKTSKPYPKPAL